MGEKEFESFLFDLLNDSEKIKRVYTFEDAGLLTRDRGLRVKLESSEEFDITIQEV